MKKTNIYLFSLLLTITAAFFPMTASAQQPGSEYAIFNWQNNGDFNAFLNCDVDSITYSRVGLDGKTYSNVVVQEVWTPDSVYRIPIATIDSVAFRAPEPVMKDGIFHITEWHYPYVTDVNDSTALTVTFDASIPSDSLPSLGQVVVSDMAYEEPFESGFAGRVVARVVTSTGKIRIECEEVNLDDIYDELVCVGKTVTYDGDTQIQTPRRISYLNEGVIAIPFGKFTLTLSETDTNYVKLNVSPELSFDYAICYNQKNLENRFKFVVHKVLDCDFDFNWNKWVTRKSMCLKVDTI